MGLMRWLRGDDETSASALSAGMAEMGGFFSPGQRKQTEHIQEQKRARKDVRVSDGGSQIDLDRGVAVIRKPQPPARDGRNDPPAQDQTDGAETAV